MATKSEVKQSNTEISRF